jgi:hypothetical protein
MSDKPPNHPQRSSEPRGVRISGDTFLMLVGLPFFVGMIATVAMIDEIFGMPTGGVVVAAAALGAITAGVLIFVQKRPAAVLLFPLLSVGWFVVLILALFLLAGQFNRFGRKTEEPPTSRGMRVPSQQLGDHLVGQQQTALGQTDVRVGDVEQAKLVLLVDGPAA